MKKLLFIFALFLTISCDKKLVDTDLNGKTVDINAINPEEAKKAYENLTNSDEGKRTYDNADEVTKNKMQRELYWEGAYFENHNGENKMVVPLKFKNEFYIYTEDTKKVLFGDISYFLVSKAKNKYDFEIITKLPDTKNKTSNSKNFNGIILVEDIFGNRKSTFKINPDGNVVFYDKIEKNTSARTSDEVCYCSNFQICVGNSCVGYTYDCGCLTGWSDNGVQPITHHPVCTNCYANIGTTTFSYSPSGATGVSTGNLTGVLGPICTNSTINWGIDGEYYVASMTGLGLTIYNSNTQLNYTASYYNAGIKIKKLDMSQANASGIFCKSYNQAMLIIQSQLDNGQLDASPNIVYGQFAAHINKLILFNSPEGGEFQTISYINGNQNSAQRDCTY